ncbi:MAG: terminase large subunit, partial [Gammaproteobacteria bacterium]|nr:terminase large subunit [Gammaproteobacteria bacterium]
EDGRNSQYSGWAIDNLLITTPGNITDFSYIEEDIRTFANTFDVQEVALDPWQAPYIMQRLQDEGLNAVEYRQTVQNMSEPMKELEALVLQNNLQHDGNPVLTWMVSNTVCHVDAKENIYPRKEFPENKIDGVVASIMAIGRAMVDEQREDINDFINDPIMI